MATATRDGLCRTHVHVGSILYTSTTHTEGKLCFHFVRVNVSGILLRMNYLKEKENHLCCLWCVRRSHNLTRSNYKAKKSAWNEKWKPSICWIRENRKLILRPWYTSSNGLPFHHYLGAVAVRFMLRVQPN